MNWPREVFDECRDRHSSISLMELKQSIRLQKETGAQAVARIRRERIESQQKWAPGTHRQIVKK